jgi:hypothetical protein
MALMMHFAIKRAFKESVGKKNKKLEEGDKKMERGGNTGNKKRQR